MPSRWTDEFISYLKSCPAYYLGPIQAALALCNTSHLWPKIDSPPILARIEEHNARIMNACSINAPKNDPDSNVFDLSMDELNESLISIRHIMAGTTEPVFKSHYLPIAKMGNYHERMAINQPLRDPFESEAEAKLKRDNMFGNPYKKPTKRIEIHLDELENEANLVANHTKRKRRSYKFNRPLPKLYKGGIFMPSYTDLKWDQVDSLLTAARGTEVEYEPIEVLVVEDERIHLPSLLSQSPLRSVSDISEMDDAIIVDEVELDALPVLEMMIPSQSEEIAPTIVDEPVQIPSHEEDWTVVRQRIHRELYRWPGEYDASQVETGRNDQENEWIRKQKEMLKRE